MWDVELNIAGYRLSASTPDIRRHYLKFNRRRVHWRLAQVRDQRAA